MDFFRKINMKPRISQDSELGGRELGGFTTVYIWKKYHGIVEN